jgi:hypothetical protein
MAERKQTPDILSEILAGTPAPEPLPIKPVTKRTEVNASRNPSPKSPGRAQSKKNRYEYEVVSLQEHKGWRIRFINGREIPNWISAPLIHETILQRASDGWELVAATSGEQLYSASDKRQLFFRRLIEG